MSQPAFVYDARVMTKGQVTIPKNVCAALGVDTGDRITFIVNGNNVRIVNSTIHDTYSAKKAIITYDFSHYSCASVHRCIGALFVGKDV